MPAITIVNGIKLVPVILMMKVPRATFRYYVKSTKARYLKLIIPEGYGNNCPPAAIRELTVYGLEW